MLPFDRGRAVHPRQRLQVRAVRKACRLELRWYRVPGFQPGELEARDVPQSQPDAERCLRILR